MPSPKIEQLQKLLQLSDHEQLVYDALNETQQLIFDLFRQAFFLSSGDAPTQGQMFAYIYTLLDPSVQAELMRLTEPPNYLKEIRAPRNHVRVGKASTDATMEQRRIEVITEAFTDWRSRLNRTENKTLLSSLTDFILRDSMYVWLPEMIAQKKRA